jgi:hypothetical protein
LVFDLYTFFGSLSQFGFFQYAVPFLIAFMILFAILDKTKVLGQNSTLHGVLAILLSLSLMTNDRLLAYMNSYLSNMTLAIVFLSLMALILMFALGIDNNWLKFFVVIFAVFAVIWTLVQASWFSPYGNTYLNVQDYLLYLGPQINLWLMWGMFIVLGFLGWTAIRRGNQSQPPRSP